MIADIDIGLVEAVYDLVQGSRGIRGHIDSNDKINAALIAGLGKQVLGLIRIIYDDANNAKFRTVCCQHGIDIDPTFCQFVRHPAQGTLGIGGKNRDLFQHEYTLPSQPWTVQASSLMRGSVFFHHIH